MLYERSSNSRLCILHKSKIIGTSVDAKYEHHRHKQDCTVWYVLLLFAEEIYLNARCIHSIQTCLIMLTLCMLGRPITLSMLGRPMTLSIMGRPITLCELGRPITLCMLGRPITRCMLGRPMTLCMLGR